MCSASARQCVRPYWATTTTGTPTVASRGISRQAIVSPVPGGTAWTSSKYQPLCMPSLFTISSASTKRPNRRADLRQWHRAHRRVPVLGTLRKFEVAVGHGEIRLLPLQATLTSVRRISPGVKAVTMKRGFTWGASFSVRNTVWSSEYPLTPAFTTLRPIRFCR